MRHLHLVGKAAKIVMRRVSRNVDFDDLYSMGCMGLMDASIKYRPAKGQFANYAWTRINGAILDGLRSDDHVPRPERERIKAGLSEGWNRYPLEAALQVPQVAYPAPEEACYWGMVLEEMVLVVSGLKEKERDVIVGYFFDQESLEQVVKNMSVKASMASRLKTDALRRLKKRMAHLGQV